MNQIFNFVRFLSAAMTMPFVFVWFVVCLVYWHFKVWRAGLMILLAGLFFCGLTFSSGAQTTNVINYGQVNGTNVGTVTTLPAYPTGPTYNLQYGPISNNPAAFGGGSYTTNGMTNSQLFQVQYSVDPYNSNWVTFGTATPTGTNGEFDVVTFPIQSLTLYQRIIAITTNALPMGAWRTR